MPYSWESVQPVDPKIMSDAASISELIEAWSTNPSLVVEIPSGPPVELPYPKARMSMQIEKTC